MKKIITIIAAFILVGCGGPSMSYEDALNTQNIEELKLHIAAGGDVNRMIVNGPVVRTPLYYAAMGRHNELVGILIDAGADVNVKYDDGPLLHLAVWQGMKSTIEILIEKGTDVNAMDINGNTPLHIAAPSGNDLYLVKLLVNKGADVNAINSLGHTPLDSITQLTNQDMADLLRKHGAKTGEELKAKKTTTF